MIYPLRIGTFVMTPNRKKAQDFILKIIAIQDPTGYNSKVYEDLFANMNDQDFHRWMEIMRQDKNAKLKLLVPPFKVVISVEAALAASKALGVKIMERIRLWDPVGKRYCLTPEKYFILRLPVRRLKQYLMDGLSVPDSDKRLNPLTDQVVKPDKGSAISFPQAQMIAEKGLTTTLHEMISIRGGDLTAYAQMKSEIEETGSSDTSVMNGTQGVKSAQTLRTSLQAMHLDTNL
jgi:hypothetical protein